MAAFDGLLHHTLVLTILLCLPVLAAATVVGLVVAVVQAATQVQEQTLALLPKLVVVGACLALLGGFGMHACAALFTDAVSQIGAIVGE
jgi:flagellar biosynthetic protein FliQ